MTSGRDAGKGPIVAVFRFRTAMLVGALFASAAGAMDIARDPRRFVRHGLSYGRQEPFSGVYFTNFENSVFVPCLGEACRGWEARPSSAVDCDKAACDDLEKRIVRLNGSHDRSGAFVITFVGRRTIEAHRPRWLGDGSQSVFIERIIKFHMLNDMRPRR